MSAQETMTVAPGVSTKRDRSSAPVESPWRHARPGLWLLWLLAASISLGLFALGIPARFESVGQQYEGQVGMSVQPAAGRALVLSPQWNGAAARAGVLDGDVLVAVNGRPVRSDQAASAASIIPEGDAGTPVALTVRTGTFPVRRVTIVRGGADGEALARIGLSPTFIAIYTIAVDVLCAILFCVIAVIMVWHRAGEWLVMLVSAMLLMTFVGVSFPVIAFYREHSSSLPILDLWIALALGSLCAFFYLFPDGRPTPRWTISLLGVLVLWTLAQPLYPALYPWKLSPLLFLLVVAAWLGSGIIAQIARYRHHADAIARQQTKWIVFGAAAAAMGLLTLVWHIGWPDGGGMGDVVYDLIIFPAGRVLEALLPVSIGLAILRYRLWDIDLIINRALVYGLLTVGVVGLYVVIVAGASALLQDQGNVLVPPLAAGLIAVLFHPLRQRLQVAVNHLMYGERDEPYIVLSRLSRRLGAALIPDALLHTVVETVAEALRLPYAAITVERNGVFSLHAAYGSPSPDPLVLPLHHHAQSVGQLILASRAPGDTFSATDRRLLEDLARETGAAVHAMLLTLDLQQSRERLVMAREEERRRLSRDLHDGLGPTLASVMLKLGSIRRRLPPESETQALLIDVRADVQNAVDDIRRLVRALRPPVLDELGLAQALRQQGAAYTQGNLTVTVTLPDRLPSLSAAVEVAAYRIALEAMTNVVRHAEATTCRLRLAVDTMQEPHTLTVEVEDDGLGLPAAPGNGIGIRSMQERAAEVGGSFTIEERTPTGTLVRVRLPILSPEGG